MAPSTFELYRARDEERRARAVSFSASSALSDWDSDSDSEAEFCGYSLFSGASDDGDETVACDIALGPDPFADRVDAMLRRRAGGVRGAPRAPPVRRVSEESLNNDEPPTPTLPDGREGVESLVALLRSAAINTAPAVVSPPRAPGPRPPKGATPPLKRRPTKRAACAAVARTPTLKRGRLAPVATKGL